MLKKNGTVFVFNISYTSPAFHKPYELIKNFKT